MPWLTRARSPLPLALLLASCRRPPPAPTERPLASPDAAAARVTPAAESPPTYNGSVAAILDAHCASCHAAGGIGPMPLETFADARAHAAAIAWETRARTMPPWLPDTRACRPLLHARALAAGEIETLARWAEAGAPEGDGPRRPVTTARVMPATPTTPTLVVAPAEGYVPKTTRADDYRCFVLDPRLEGPTRVTAVRVDPGARGLVHHVLLFEVRAPAVERLLALDARDAGPGYGCFGGIGIAPTVRPGDLARGTLVDFDAQMVVGWAPGAGATDVAGAPTPLPAGTGIELAPGSRLVMQVHYSLENQERVGAAADRTRIELSTAPEGAAVRQALWVPILDRDFRVPAGVGPEDPRAVARTVATLPFPLEILGVAPHMHLRGKEITVEALPDDAPPACLLQVPRWSFHHQEGYWLAEGVRTRRAALTCRWDNRQEAQPLRGTRRRPAHELAWGEGTEDEMCLAFLYATL